MIVICRWASPTPGAPPSREQERPESPLSYSTHVRAARGFILAAARGRGWPERLSRSAEDAAGCKPRTLGSDVCHGRRWAPSPPPSDGPSLPLQLSLFWRPDQASRCLHPGPQEPTRAPQRPRGRGPGSPLSGAVAGAAVSVRMKGGIEGWAPRRLAPRQPHNAGFVQPAGLS